MNSYKIGVAIQANVAVDVERRVLCRVQQSKGVYREGDIVNSALRCKSLLSKSTTMCRKSVCDDLKNVCVVLCLHTPWPEVMLASAKRSPFQRRLTGCDGIDRDCILDIYRPQRALCRSARMCIAHAVEVSYTPAVQPASLARLRLSTFEVQSGPLSICSF